MTKLQSSFAFRNFSLAWPLALNALLVHSMLMVDTLLVAPLGEQQLAAMGIATTIVAFAVGIQFALSNGTQLIVGRAKGAENKQALIVAFGAGLLINFLVAIAFWLGLIFGGPSLIAVLIDDPTLVQMAVGYLSITKYLILITAFTQLCTSFFNGCGETKIPFTGYLLELPFNILISYFLIYGTSSYAGLGVEGAAWGSLAAVGLRMLYLLYSLNSSKLLHHSAPPNNNLIDDFRNHFVEIFPIAANFIVLSVGMTVYQLLYAKLDLYSYVAITLVFPWIRMGTQIMTGWAQASAIIISQAIGQKQSDQIQMFVTTSIKLAMSAACVLALLFYLLSKFLVYIYPNVSLQSHLALAAIAPIYILLPLVRTYNTVAGHSMRSIGQSVKVLKIHFVAQWLIALPICALMVLYFKLSVFWVFAVVLLEEMLKSVPFHRLMRNKLSGYHQLK